MEFVFGFRWASVRTVVHCTALLQHCFNLIGGGPGGPKGEIPATIARNGSATRAGSSKQATANAGRWEFPFVSSEIEKEGSMPKKAVKDSKIFVNLPHWFMNSKKDVNAVLENNC